MKLIAMIGYCNMPLCGAWEEKHELIPKVVGPSTYLFVVQLERTWSTSKVCGVLSACSWTVSCNGSLFPYCSLCPLLTFPAVAVHADVLAVVADWLPTDSGSTYHTRSRAVGAPWPDTSGCESFVQLFLKIGVRQVTVFHMCHGEKLLKSTSLTYHPKFKTRFQYLRGTKLPFLS